MLSFDRLGGDPFPLPPQLKYPPNGLSTNFSQQHQRTASNDPSLSGASITSAAVPSAAASVPPAATSSPQSTRIRDVWITNLETEMRSIREVVENYPYIAMDTEFPGVVARPIGSFKTSSDYHYQTMRCNVDLLKIIQIGLTFSDAEGNYPPEVCTWQFNFRFSVKEDMYAPESIDLLQKSGIDFQRHEEQGITPNEFAELITTSGIVLTDESRWISFHGGYDFGYLVKVLTNITLPVQEAEFFEILNTWFPRTYDIKYIMRACKVLKGGLQDVADELNVLRTGPSHQAGSDSLLTASTFFKMRELYFNGTIDDDEYAGRLYGLGQTFEGMRGPGPLTNFPGESGPTPTPTPALPVSTPGLTGYPPPYGLYRPPVGVGV